MRVRLKSNVPDPWTHQELPVGGFDELGDAKRDENGDVKYQEFHPGDVVEVSDDTAEHLIRSGQAEQIEPAAG